MSKKTKKNKVLSKQLRIYMAESGIKTKDIAGRVGCSLQSIINWRSDEACPHKIDYNYAFALHKISKGKITMEACGHGGD